MKLSIAAAIALLTMSTTVNARLHPDKSKKNRELQWGPPKNMVERSLVNPAISALRDDVDRLDAEDDTLNGRINETDTAIDTANTEITELQDDVISLEAANVTLRVQIATADNAISTANANITALAYRLEEAEATISAAVATISTLNARVQVLEAALTQRIVFVTSVGYIGGQIGAIAGADSKCQTLANAAPRLSGIFKAWLSDRNGNSPAQNFVKSDVPYVNTNGIKVANDWLDLITDDASGSGIFLIRSGVFLNNSIAFDEKGDSTSGVAVWTGTDVTGMPESGVGTFCNDWTSISGGAYAGYNSFTDPRWTSSGFAPCDNTFRLYCFEQ